MALEKVPFIQKRIIERARDHGKFVITATQMLESMVEAPVPTRAEVSDVANAIYDGTDAVMLSAETSMGKYPVEAVRMMASIAREAEITARDEGFKRLRRDEHHTPSWAETMAETAYRCAREQGAVAIIVFTVSGSSAQPVARTRPPVPIYAFTKNAEVARQLSILYGVVPILTPDPANTDEMVMQLDQLLLGRGLVKPRDTVVIVAGQPIGRPGTTSFVKLHGMGELW
jgi:pyruvate kinase